MARARGSGDQVLPRSKKNSFLRALCCLPCPFSLAGVPFSPLCWMLQYVPTLAMRAVVPSFCVLFFNVCVCYNSTPQSQYRVVGEQSSSNSSSVEDLRNGGRQRSWQRGSANE